MSRTQKTETQDDRFLSKEEWLKALIEHYNRYIRTLNLMKTEEKRKGELGNGRRKWFNREKDRLKDEIRDCKKELESMR